MILEEVKHPTEYGTTLPCASADWKAWFPDTNLAEGEGLLAVKICKACPIQEECLAWALRHEGHGIWGGETPNARKKMRRELGIQFSEPETVGYVSENRGLRRHEEEAHA